jgi:uncharacterized repeat protein (TIGR01451 family)
MIAAPFGGGTAWAASGETDAGVTISNTATIGYSVSGVSQTRTSDTADFVVDHKVRPVVTWDDTANVPVVAGSADQYLTFVVLNDGNTATGDTAAFNLSTLTSGAFNMGTMTYYEETNSTAGLQTGAGGDTLVTAVSLARDTDTTVYVVGTTPAGVSAGDTSTYHLIATSPLTEATTNALNGPADDVFADDAGSAAGDIAYDGRHSDDGVFEAVVVDLSSTKTSSVISDGINTAAPYFAIPGAVVQYEMVITNNGVLQAAGVTVSDIMPDEVDYRADSVRIEIGGVETGYSDSDPEVTYTSGAPGTEALSVAVGDIDPGNSVTVRFNVEIQ